MKSLTEYMFEGLNVTEAIKPDQTDKYQVQCTIKEYFDEPDTWNEKFEKDVESVYDKTIKTRTFKNVERCVQFVVNSGKRFGCGDGQVQFLDKGLYMGIEGKNLHITLCNDVTKVSKLDDSKVELEPISINTSIDSIIETIKKQII